MPETTRIVNKVHLCRRHFDDYRLSRHCAVESFVSGDYSSGHSSSFLLWQYRGFPKVLNALDVSISSWHDAGLLHCYRHPVIRSDIPHFLSIPGSVEIDFHSNISEEYRGGARLTLRTGSGNRTYTAFLHELHNSLPEADIYFTDPLSLVIDPDSTYKTSRLYFSWSAIVLFSKPCAATSFRYFSSTFFIFLDITALRRSPSISATSRRL